MIPTKRENNDPQCPVSAAVRFMPQDMDEGRNGKAPFDEQDGNQKGKIL